MKGRPPRHGMTNTPLHKSWIRMIGRCRNKHPKNKYLERGIGVSKEWETFENFFRDMSATYKVGLSLERIDNTKGYSKENCCWATMKEQAQNRSSTVKVLWKRKEYTLSQLAEKYRIPYSVFWRRLKLYKWSLDRAVTTPVLNHQEIGKLSVMSINHINNKRSIKRLKA